MVHMHNVVGCGTAVIAAGLIEEGCASTGRKPGVIRIDEHPVGIIWVHCYALVVPVLWVITRIAARVATNAIPQRTALGAGHKRPGGPAVGAGPNSNLASVGVAAASVIVPLDRLHLGVDDIGITRCDGKVQASQLVGGAAANTSATGDRIIARHTGACIHGRSGCIRAAGHCGAKYKAVIVAAGRGEIGRATTHRHRASVKAVRSILSEIVLHEGRKTTHANRREDARYTRAHVTQFKPGDVLALSSEAISQARSSPVCAAVIGKIETFLCASYNVVAVIRIDAHFANCVVLWELAGRFLIGWPEDIGAKHCPCGTGVGRLQNALATHRKRTVVKIAGAGINSVMI